MTKIEKLIFCFGLTILILIAIVIIVYLVYGVRNLFQMIGDKRAFRAGQQSIKDTGARIKSAAYWFSQYPEIYNTLTLIGSDLVNYGHFDIGSIREKVKELNDKKL